MSVSECVLPVPWGHLCMLTNIIRLVELGVSNTYVVKIFA